MSCEFLAPLGASRAGRACSAAAAWGGWCAAHGCANTPPTSPGTAKGTPPLLIFHSARGQQ
jgi:hypothetical protein